MVKCFSMRIHVAVPAFLQPCVVKRQLSIAKAILFCTLVFISAMGKHPEMGVDPRAGEGTMDLRELYAHCGLPADCVETPHWQGEVVTLIGYLDPVNIFHRNITPQLPYEKFAEAYDEIGCTNQATDIRRIISSFPFSDPHLKIDKRANYIHDNYDGEALEVRKWGDALCGDKEVWEKLTVFYKKHEKDFA